MDMFIEKVRLSPCLWDTGHISYRDIGKKDLVWDRIAMECGMDNGREAKNQFKKLRDSHREALRRRRYATGTAAQNMKPWKYEAEMAFLLPQSETTANVTTYTDDTEDSVTYTTETTDNTDTDSPLPLEVSLATPSLVDVENKKRRKLANESVTEISQERERREQRPVHRDDLSRQAIDMNRPQDALSTLFDSLCQKTRELPKYLQLRVQREIFESVTRAEEEALDPISTYFSPTSSTSSYEYAGARNHQTSSPGGSKSQRTSSDVKSEKIDRCYLE